MTTKIQEKECFLQPLNLFIAEYLIESPVTVILIPPLFEEHPRTRKLLVNTARYLASNGIRTIRFDYAGTGLSLDSSRNLSPESTIQDLDLVCKHAIKSYGSEILLIGFRYGGYISVQYQQTLNQNIPCLLWEPIMDLSKYFKFCLKIALTNQLVTLGTIKENKQALLDKLDSGGYVLVDGYPMSSDFYKQCKTSSQDLFSKAMAADNTEAIFWKNKQGHNFVQTLNIPSTLLKGIKTSWENIRFIDNQPDDLLKITLDWCKKYAA